VYLRWEFSWRKYQARGWCSVNQFFSIKRVRSSYIESISHEDEYLASNVPIPDKRTTSSHELSFVRAPTASCELADSEPGIPSSNTLRPLQVPCDIKEVHSTYTINLQSPHSLTPTSCRTYYKSLAHRTSATASEYSQNNAQGFLQHHLKLTRVANWYSICPTHLVWNLLLLFRSSEREEVQWTSGGALSQACCMWHITKRDCAESHRDND